MARVLWFHPRQLVPPRGGGDLRGLGLVEGALAAGHQVLLAYPDEGLVRDGDLPAGSRVSTVRLRSGLSRALTKVLSRDPLRSARATTDSLTRARAEIEAFGPDLAVVSQVMSWPIARRLLPDTPWVYDAHNVERDLFAAHLRLAHGTTSRLTFAMDLRRVTVTERRMLVESDAVLAVSPTDADALMEIGRLSRRPTVVPSSVSAPSVMARPSAAGQVVLFVGTLDFPPNVEAVHTLVDEIMPAVVQRVPEARLLVAGRQPSSDLRALLRSRPWIEFADSIPDIADVYLRARCAVLPFGSGAGTKLKLFEALAFALPVVATPGAQAGVDLTEDETLVGATSAALIDGVVELLEDPAEADLVGVAGRAAFDDRLSWQKAAYPALQAVLHDLSLSPAPLAASREQA